MILTIEEAMQIVGLYDDLVKDVDSGNLGNLNFGSSVEDDEYIDKYISFDLNYSEDSLCVEFDVVTNKIEGQVYVSEDIWVHSLTNVTHSYNYWLNEIIDFIKENE